MARKERKSGPKSAKKPVFLPISAHLLFLSLSTVTFSHHHPHHRSSHHFLQPPATISNHRHHHCTSSSTPLQPGKPLFFPFFFFFFAVAGTEDVNYNSRPTVHAWTVAWIIIHVHFFQAVDFIFYFFFWKNIIQKNFKKIILKNLWFFSNIFYQFLHNIDLYIYIVKYKSSIKIPGFLQNIYIFFKIKCKTIISKKCDFLA